MAWSILSESVDAIFTMPSSLISTLAPDTSTISLITLISERDTITTNWKKAKEGRLHILGEMSKAISTAGQFSVHAPKIETMQVATDKIREVIGSGGKVIREIVEVSGAKVDINDDGIVKIASTDSDKIDHAIKMIKDIVDEPEAGQIYTGKVVKIMDFGAFVNFFGKRDGLVHVSQLANERVNHPKDVLKEGQEVKVKLLGFDDRGKVRLSMKVVDQETGEEIKTEKTEKKD